jgi:hypothetical protein
MKRFFFITIVQISLGAARLSAIDLDGDGMSDVWEAIYSVPAADANKDYDGIGLTNVQKSQLGLDPRNPNSRFHLEIVRDAAQNQLRLWIDTAYGKLYQVESSTDRYTWSAVGPVITGTGSPIPVITTMPDPSVTPFFRHRFLGDVDADGDGLTAWEEHQIGTSDQSSDTDGDGMPDSWEFSHGLNPLLNDAAADPDGDGLTNVQEFQHNTNPTAADTDGDGFDDGAEVANGTDPNNSLDFGRLERSVWTGLSGTKVSDLTRNPAYTQPPAVREFTTHGAMAPSNYGDNFGQRLRGTFLAPVTGSYTFWIASDDSGELWIGTSESRLSKVRVAAVNGWVTEQAWDSSPTQKSVSLDLIAGQRYWIEALAKEEGFDDHLAVAWQYPGQERQVIPAAFLRPPAVDPADSNDDNLPDAWAAEHGVIDGEYGDSDNDGLSNFDEYRCGTDPKVAGGVPGYLSRDVWYGLNPSSVVTLTRDRRFLAATPDWRDLSPGSAFPQNDRANDWGQRFRGTLTAPATGFYTLYVAADDNAELWLSTDDRKFQKKRIAWVEGSSSYTDPGQFDKYLTQKSAPVTLIAGRKYYIEVLHTDAGGPEHVSIGWRRPGELNIESIPAQALQSFVRDPDDLDDDDLPDSWETQYGLDKTDGGQTDPRQGSFGDYDRDGLTNREEYLFGTNPVIADTDGDGVSDFDEVNGTHTDPLAPDLGALSDAVVLTGSQATANQLGLWTTDGADIYAADRRGYVEYSLNVPTADVYRLEVEGSANGYAESTNSFDLVLSVDGESLGHSTLATLGTATAKVGAFTPWLPAGMHVVRIFWDNPASAKSLRIKFVRLQTVPGVDTNGNGVKDWVERLLASRNGITTPGAPIDSYVSPAFLEGRGRFISMISVTAAPDGVTANVGAQHGADETWYTNVPLASSAATVVTVSSESGGLTETKSIRWIPKNILSGGNLTIRKGDSLLLTAYPSGGAVPPSSGSCAITVGSTQYSTSPAEPVAHSFSAAGTYLVSASFSDGSETASGSITVTVLGYSFSTAPQCWVGRARNWDVPNLPSEVVLQVDSRIALTELAPTGNSEQRMQLQIDQNEPRYAVARIGANGPVLAAARADGFKLFAGPDTYNYTVEVYPDESRLIETMVISSPVSPTINVKVSIIVGGVTFDDGTTVKYLTFDELGQSTVRFLMPASAETANCHRIEAYQNSVLVGGY